MNKILACLLVLSVTQAHGAIFNIIGWETGDAIEPVATVGTFSVQTTVKRTGGYALRVNPTTTATGSNDMRKLSTAGNAVTIGEDNTYTRFYFLFDTLPAASDEIIFDSVTSTAASKFELRINSAGQLVAYNAGLAALGTGATVLSASTWYRIEVRVGTGISSTYEVLINGVSELSGTADTLLAQNGRSRFGKTINRNGNSVSFYYDDAAADNANYPGPGAIEAMFPDSDGSSTTWTIGAGTGAEWEQVDESPNDGDTTYLASTLGVGDASSVGLESSAIAGVSGAIAAVKSVFIRKRAGATNGNILLRLRSGVTTSNSGSHATTSAYDIGGILFLVDPADSLPFDTSDLDGAEIGVVENNATNASRWTSSLLMVEFNSSPPTPIITPRRQRFIMRRG